ncbi:M3 family oligoendopeptidase [Pontibacter sp. G13]|uniref:M3 family oligoendopeptidase n=1 Tax=Pontibacter sp. G13 TaxID=3074898 RepID=UPI00288BB45D|nr:M3 family oligoendopeptidase [Pontibacter sp. G13]WNJ21107.1 M3 family oligoendopeptidase [Pontibacter sp. G13]
MQQYLQIRDRKAERTFVPVDFQITDWESLEPFYQHLLSEEVQSLEDLENFLKMRNELDAMVEEELAWRYIRMTCHIDDEDLKSAYSYYVEQIWPKVTIQSDLLNRKIAEHPAFSQLPDQPYLTYVRKLKRQIALFHEENIPLITKSQTLSREHGNIMGAMTITHEGKELTIQQASKLLEAPDRTLREEAWSKIHARRNQDAERLQDVFDELLELRNQIAVNAGYPNYTQYKFDQLGRFDYTLEDTHLFHDAVEAEVKPIYEALLRERQGKLGLDTLRPWDLSVDIFGSSPLHPFDSAEELRDKTIDILRRIKPELGDMIQIMVDRGFMDLESRKGKAPGGYNYPLMESGVPFIFMNAAGTQVDVTTILHEAGHAIHSFFTSKIPINALKQTPSEVAELASMSMELLSLDGYDEFYSSEADRARAKKNQLLRCISVIPWIATIDAFQQWLYNNPTHTREERAAKWRECYHRFHGNLVDWTGFEGYFDQFWIKQGHVFDVPFYYIEYGLAQLGALAVWKNYRQNPAEGLEAYLSALQLGYMAPIPKIYEQAGIEFNFSKDYVRECMTYCKESYDELAV